MKKPALELKHRIPRILPYLFLAAIAAFSLSVKLNTLDVGAPYVTIDDNTMYEGGFLVWFGQAPPQRMYLESWISGIVSLSTYTAKTLATGGSLGLNLVADAYRDFYADPDHYVKNYRILMLIVDLLTAVFIFLTARNVFKGSTVRDHAAVLSTAFFLLTYNTLWCYLVARPDTVTTFLATVGLYFYYRSDLGRNGIDFMLSGVMLGLATGMKLHAAFFVIFICVDIWRLWGFRQAVQKLLPFGLISVITFLVASGSALFDPSLYVKLRLLNMRDDESPWLEWGDQFIALFKGTGWLILPVVAATIIYAVKSRVWRTERAIASVLLLSILWLLLFSSIRVLRPYWILPALPLFYMAAAYGLAKLQAGTARYVQYVAVIMIVGVMGWQLVDQRREFIRPDYDQLRHWIVENVQPSEAFYVLGYTAVNLPRNTETIQVLTESIRQSMQAAVEQRESYTSRHIRLWEERARFQLYDMLNFQSEQGYQYYGYNQLSPRALPEGTMRGSMKYVLWQEHFSFPADEADTQRELNEHYREVVQVIGPGGGGRGLSYRIFKRVD